MRRWDHSREDGLRRSCRRQPRASCPDLLSTGAGTAVARAYHRPWIRAHCFLVQGPSSLTESAGSWVHLASEPSRAPSRLRGGGCSFPTASWGGGRVPQQDGGSEKERSLRWALCVAGSGHGSHTKHQGRLFLKRVETVRKDRDRLNTHRTRLCVCTPRDTPRDAWAACRGSAGPSGTSGTEQEFRALGCGHPVPLGERGPLSTDVDKRAAGRASPGRRRSRRTRRIRRSWVWGRLSYKLAGSLLAEVECSKGANASYRLP